MEFTGERFVPEVHGNIELEHLHRYLQACQIAADKEVLDIASGEGYGSAMLASRANKVTGVDISVEAVKHARKRYKKENLEYMVGSCADIPLPDASVDLVVSFETIEHHDQHKKMMEEVSRVLRRAGVLLISSPDKYHYSVEPGSTNQYHIKELYQHEFKQLLGKYFKNVAYFGQRVIFGSGIFAESLPTSFLCYSQENEIIREARGMVKPLYWIALASNDQLPKLAGGVLEQPINDSEVVQSWARVAAERADHISTFRQQLAERDDHISTLGQQLAERDDHISTLGQQLAERDDHISTLGQQLVDRDREIASINGAAIERDREKSTLSQLAADRDVEIAALNQAIIQLHGQITDLNDAVTVRDREIARLNEAVIDLTDKSIRRGEWVARLESELKESQFQLSAILRSRSWRMTLPLREARWWLQTPKAQAKRYAKAVLKRLKWTYQALPLSAETNALHRNWLARHVPRLLLATGARLPIEISPLPEISASPSSKPLEKIALPTSVPIISVIVPVCGRIDYTLRWLKWIENHPPKLPFEVIVVDDCSADYSSKLLSEVEGIRLITNTRNVEFVSSCNSGAKAASGEYLLFLKNDTEVSSCCMDKLLATVDGSPRTQGVKIAAVTMVYNEAFILPYFLRHYSYLDEIHVLYETDSTDESLEILMQTPNVVIEEGHIEGGLDDIEKVNIINKAMQRINADWVYVVDPDELIFPPNNESPHDFLKRQSCDVVRSGMYQVYRHRTDKDLDPSLPPIPQRIHGDPDLYSTETETIRTANDTYIKPNIVRPSKHLRFLAGHHFIEGDPQTSPELYVGAHWQMAEPSFAIARRMERKARVSERNKSRQLGWQHFDVTEDKISEECERHLDDPIIPALRSFREPAGQNFSVSQRDAHPKENADYISEIKRILSNAFVPAYIDGEESVEVVIPVYNAYDEFLRCLYSLFKHQDIYRIILLDDCSPDIRLKDFFRFLKDYEGERFKIEANPQNLGYLKTVNKGMRMAKNDVILLNTDTVVTRGWARKMRGCAYSDPRIATVTPFTNNGRMCSVPEFLANNEIPKGFTVDSFAECVEKASSRQYPELVTAVGFCMYVRRSVIDEIGYFDDINFEMGYGEESDFSFRAACKGYKNVLCDDTFVFHKGRASFLDTQNALMEKNHKVLAERYPEFWAAIALFERSNPLKEFHNRLKKEMEAWNGRKGKS
jgi:GT2 family glycosyltransferase/SAM-dependent methyltransferase